MNKSIETRELVTVNVDGICVRGTYHKPGSVLSASRSNTTEKHSVGVLFVNPGFQPRAAQGDSAVFWADSLAKCGYPSFRLDLPGLGDSDGDAPMQMLDFVNAGGYAPVVAAAMEDLAKRFKLSGLVVVGLCAGAVTALYAAAASKRCTGAVLMDPYFFQTQDTRPQIRVQLTRWAAWSRLGAFTSNLYDRAKHVTLLVRGNRLPRNANLPLLECWNRLTSAGIPILVLRAPALKSRGVSPRLGQFDYFTYLQTRLGHESRVTMEFIEGTDHSFADNHGREAVEGNIMQWLNSSFSFKDLEISAARNGLT